MKKIRIAAAGDNCMDVYDKENKAFPGGNPVNVAVYVARLGGAAAYIGPVGTDAYGKQMMDAIQGKGVDVSRMKILEGTTAVTHVEIVDGDRVLGDYEEGVMADFKLDEEDIDFLSSYDMVVSGLWGMIENDLPVLKEKGATVAFDFATRPDDPVSIKAIPYVDYGFFADDDKDEEELKKMLIGLHAKGPKVWLLPAARMAAWLMTARSFIMAVLCPVKWWIPWGQATALSQDFFMLSAREREFRKLWRTVRLTAV